MENRVNEGNIELLDQKREELVDMLKTAMESRKLNFLETESGDVSYIYHKVNNGGYHTLHFDGSDDLDSEVGEEGNGSYMYGDFNCWVSRCTPEQVVNFIESWDDIVDAVNFYDKEIEEVCSKEFQTI